MTRNEIQKFEGKIVKVCLKKRNQTGLLKSAKSQFKQTFSGYETDLDDWVVFQKGGCGNFNLVSYNDFFRTDEVLDITLIELEKTKGEIKCQQ